MAGNEEAERGEAIGIERPRGARLGLTRSRTEKGEARNG